MAAGVSYLPARRGSMVSMWTNPWGSQAVLAGLGQVGAPSTSRSPTIPSAGARRHAPPIYN